MSRKYQSYYTHSEPLVNRMVRNLSLNGSDLVFEPCGGDGVFIDAIMQQKPECKISVFELNPNAYMQLKGKYSNCKNVVVKNTDTLLDSELLEQSCIFDKIIANPPYGAKSDEDRIGRINEIYSNLYTKESYILFLYRCVVALKYGGRLSFIIPDTFLSLNRHLAIREFLLRKTSISEILLFPSSFFPNVNFGYANLCIITLDKFLDENVNLKNQITIKSGYNTVDDIETDDYTTIQKIKQSDVLSNVGSSFLLGANDYCQQLINSPDILKIGDFCSCVTGFYSGNDKAYLHPASSDVRNAKKYQIANQDMINESPLSSNEKVNGISSGKILVPIVKGGNVRFVKKTEWYMDWSVKAMGEYRSSKKCRLQNTQFYFQKYGVAIPMIRSKKLTAALINGRLFDQSIVGVFPEDENLTYMLLAFFNSDICTELINMINPSTNNSANYIKRLPFIVPDESLKSKIITYTKKIVNDINQNGTYEERDLNVLNEIFNQLYSSQKCEG